MDAEARVAIDALTKRVAALEDQLALYQCVSTYGPAVDSMQVDDACALWQDDGIYVGDTRLMDGRSEIAAMLNGEFHTSLVEHGCAHVMSLPLIRIDGDRAVGLGYHRLYHNTDSGFRLLRLVVSRWDWTRMANGWKATRRIHRLLDGSETARELLRDTLREIQGGPPAEITLPGR